MQPTSRKRSQSWAAATVVRAAEAKSPTFWARRNFWIEDRADPVTGAELGPGLIQLAAHQERIIEAALERDDLGRFRWSTVVYSAVKKSGKTRIAAMVAAWLAANAGKYQEIYCLANDGKQSADRVLAAVKKANDLGHLGWHDKLTRVELPNGSFIEAVPVDPTGEAGANPTASVWCLDEATEVLTRDGWRTWETLEDDAHVATLDALGQFEWQQPNGVYRSYHDGLMYYINHKRMSACVTPEHRMWGQFGQHHRPLSSAQLLPAWEAAQMPFYAPVMKSEWQDDHDFRFTTLKGTKRRPDIRIDLDLWMRFMGWYLSEGCVAYGKHGPEAIQIGQSKKVNPKKRAEIIGILRAMSFTPHEWADDMNIVVYDVRLAQYCSQFGTSGDKFIPTDLKNLPKRYLRAFLDAYLRGDGHRHGNGWRIITASRQMRDDLLEVGQKCGFAVSYQQRIDKRWQPERTQYCVRLMENGTPRIEHKHWSRRHYCGMVYCPSTENGIIFVRRNGTCYWTGNSEMWGFRLSAKERLWSEFTIPPTRHGRAIRWVESYAGYTGESPVLEQLYHEGVEEGRPHPSFPDLPVYVNDRARLFCYWDHEPRMAWQTPEYYQAEAALLHPLEFARIHRNEWVSAIGQAIPVEAWDRCHDPRMPALVPGTPIVLGLDAGVSGDCTALVAVSRHPLNNSMAAIRAVEVWEPPVGGQMDYTQTIEASVRKWCKAANVVCVVYDPYQLHKMATDLRREGLGWFEEFSQGQQRAIADKQMVDLVTARKVAHNGDPTLRQHVINAAAKLEGEKSMRFVKRSDRLKIDSLVAASMAVFQSLKLNL